MGLRCHCLLYQGWMDERLCQAATVGVSSSWWAGSQTEYPTNCEYCSVQLRKVQSRWGGESCRIHRLTRYVEEYSKSSLEFLAARVSHLSPPTHPNSWWKIASDWEHHITSPRPAKNPVKTAGFNSGISMDGIQWGPLVNEQPDCKLVRRDLSVNSLQLSVCAPAGPMMRYQPKKTHENTFWLHGENLWLLTAPCHRSASLSMMIQIYKYTVHIHQCTNLAWHGFSN